MASEQQVKRYLAYWFQLGKRVVIRNGEETIRPKTVLSGNCYSQEFEEFWQTILSPESGNCYLENTNETIAQLLTPAWDVSPCARCLMPVPVRSVGMPPEACPCNDIPSWPNTSIPAPRSPVDSQGQLVDIRERLLRIGA